MENANKNLEIKKLMNANQKISKQKFIGAIKSFIGDDGYIYDHGIDSDTSEHEVTFSKPDDYRYGIIMDAEKNNYISIILDFGDLNGFINEAQMDVLKKEVDDINKTFRCVRGIIYKDNSSGDEELLFSIRYDSYILPSITASQITQHMSMALSEITSYLDETLDVARNME